MNRRWEFRRHFQRIGQLNNNNNTSNHNSLIVVVLSDQSTSYQSNWISHPLPYISILMRSNQKEKTFCYITLRFLLREMLKCSKNQTTSFALYGFTHKINRLRSQIQTKCRFPLKLNPLLSYANSSLWSLDTSDYDDNDWTNRHELK